LLVKLFASPVNPVVGACSFLQPDLKRLQSIREELDTLVHTAAVHTVTTAVIPALKEQREFEKVGQGTWNLGSFELVLSTL
jgi:hypothetical protein